MLSNPRSKTLRYALALLLPFSFFISASAAVSPWHGPYLGAYLGDAFGYNRASTNTGSVTDTSYFTTTADINTVNNAGTYSSNPNVGIVGIQAGQDWGWQEIVFGVAADYSTLSLGSSKRVMNATYPDNSDQYSIHTSINTNWLFTLRSRLGYQANLFCPTLFYVTGGFALAKLKVSNNFTDNSSYLGMGGGNTSKNQIGWTLGGGIEFAVIKHLSVDLEYAYVDIPSIKTINSISNTSGGFGIAPQSLTNPLSTTARFHANLLKLGLNYRFN